MPPTCRRSSTRSTPSSRRASARAGSPTTSPQLARVDPRRFGLAVVDARRRGARRRRRRRRLLDPEHLQGLPADAGARQARREPLDATSAASRRAPPSTRSSSSSTSTGRPRNPFINAGAIVVTDLVLAGHSPREAIGEILRFLRFLADDDDITIDAEVARSEAATGARNYALAQFMRSLRPARASGRPGARGLLPPLRHRHELPPARPRRPLPRRRRPQPAHRALGGARRPAPGGSTR